MSYTNSIRHLNPTIFNVLNSEERLIPLTPDEEDSRYHLNLHPSETWKKPNSLHNTFLIKLQKGQLLLYKSDYQSWRGFFQ